MLNFLFCYCRRWKLSRLGTFQPKSSRLRRLMMMTRKMRVKVKMMMKMRMNECTLVYRAWSIIYIHVCIYILIYIYMYMTFNLFHSLIELSHLGTAAAKKDTEEHVVCYTASVILVWGVEVYMALAKCHYCCFIFYLFFFNSHF